MKTFTMMASAAILFCATATSQGQHIQQGPNGWVFQMPRVQSIVGQMSPSQAYPIQTFPGQPNPNPGWNPAPGRPPIYTLPQHPVFVSPDRIVGRNPYTGGWDTTNEQVDNTYFDPTRNASRQNGTERYVKRPIYGADGRVVGYQEGVVWNNSHTGVEHGELKNVTENGQGGVNSQIQIKRDPSPNGK